ncbi:hypothetical protein Tco_0190821 [Tanacetum coccineum]
MPILVHFTNCPSMSEKLPLVPWSTPTSYSSESVKWLLRNALLVARIHTWKTRQTTFPSSAAPTPTSNEPRDPP